MTGSNNIQLVDHSSNVFALVSKDPAAFNGTVEALEGLQEITESGIERIIAAINGLNKAKTYDANDSEQTKSAVAKAVARDMQQSATITPIEKIEIEAPNVAPVTIEKPEKPRSVNAEKALSGYKPDRTEFYQHDTTNVHTQNSYADNRDFHDNHTNFVQNHEANDASSANSNRSKTVFNQLSSSVYDRSTKRENTTSQNLAVEGDAKATSEAIENNAVSSTPSAATTESTAIEKQEKIDEIKATNASDSRSYEKGNAVSSEIATESSASNSNQQLSSNQTREKPVSVGNPTFDFANRTGDTLNQNVKGANTQATDNQNSQSASRAIETEKSHDTATDTLATASEVVNGTDSHTTTLQPSKQVESVSEGISELASSIDNHSNVTAKVISEHDKQAHTAHTDSNQDSSSVNTETKASANEVKRSESSISAIDKSEANNTKSAFSASNYYKDANERLRHKSGRFASNDEKSQYAKQHSKGDKPSIVARAAKHITAKNARKVIGSAFLGSGYLAIEEALSNAKNAKYAAVDKGLTSTDGIKKYIASKQAHFTQRVNDTTAKVGGAFGAAKSSVSQVRGTVKNLTHKLTGNRSNEHAQLNITNNASEAKETNSTKSDESSVNAHEVNANDSNSINSIENAVVTGENAEKPKPSTVDGMIEISQKPSINSTSSRSKEVKAMANYVQTKAGNSSNQRIKAITKNNSNSAYSEGSFIGALPNRKDASSKLQKEYHDEHMLKLAMLIKAVEDVSVNVSGGADGGGSFLDDLLDLGDDKKNKKRNKRRGKPSRFSRLKDAFKSSRFFVGGAKVAGALGAGGMVAGGLDIASGASQAASGTGAAGAAGKTGAAGKFGMAGKAASAGKFGLGALGGLGRVASKAIPILAIASTAYDAYEGFTNTDKQREAFNLKSTEAPNLGHKSAMGLASVLDLGGITSGAAGLLGDGLGALGFDGAKEALQFDSGDIAKAIYSKGENLVNNGSSLFSSIAEGDFKTASESGLNLMKELIPVLNVFGSSESKEVTKEASKKANSVAKSDSESVSATSQSASAKDISSDKSSTQTIDTASSQSVAQTSVLAPAIAANSLERVTDISSIESAAAGGTNAQDRKQKPDTHIVVENKEMLALLSKISKQLELNRKNEQPNNGGRLSAGINSVQKSVPTKFSDPLMERLANE